MAGGLEMNSETMSNEGMQSLLDWVRGHYFGKYRGTVSDNEDPTTRGRLKVKVPAVLAGLEVWAMPCVPYAGDKVGFYSLPAAGAGVWVEFEAGDPSYPVWTGCFWGDGELPEDASGPAIKIWKTDSLTIKADDDNDELLMQNTAESKITIGKDDVKTESNDSTYTVGEDVITESGKAKLTVGSAGIVSEQSSGKVEVTKSGVKINDGALEVA